MDKALYPDHPVHWWTWKALCAQEEGMLRHIPFKVELNRYNQIIVAPANYRHSRRQTKISRLLARLLKGGEASVETAVLTSDNVKVPDVVWASQELARKYEDAYELPVAPEICVEVLSPSNTAAEIDQKLALYFEAGAHEVWICDPEGKMHFHTPAGPLERSALCPKFPPLIRL